MKSMLKNMMCRFMIVALMMLPFQTAQAGMIGADQVNSAAAVQADRNLILNHLSRSQTVNEFQSMGLDAQAAMDRVAAMTDAEVSSLAGKINAVPAGGTYWALFIVAGLLIWYFAFRR